MVHHSNLRNRNKNLSEESNQADSTIQHRTDLTIVNQLPPAGGQDIIEDHNIKGSGPGSDTVEFQEQERQDNPHSSNPLRTSEGRFLERYPDKLSIGWPVMTNQKAWDRFQSVVCRQLPLLGSVSTRLSQLENIVYDTAAQQFGHLVRPVKRHHNFNHQKYKTIELVDKKKPPNK